nr:ribonuclease H-like domain-containing protein [Tanacetum cinerariifolium]
MALLSMRDDRFWKKRGKNISIQGTYVVGFDKSKVECFNCHKMGHFARECRAPKSQDKGRRDNYRQWSKVEEHTLKALMAIDGMGWDWSFMANEQEDHALVANEEAPTEFALMPKTSADSEVCHRLKVDWLSISLKDLDSLLESQRLDKNKEGLGYSVVPPPVQVYSPPKKDLSWTGILEFADDTVTNYSRPSPAIESTSDDAQNRNPSVLKIKASPSTIPSKPFIKFVKAPDPPTVTKSDKKETVRKPSVKYAKLYRKPTKRSNVRGNKRNWNNLKSQQLGNNFVMKKACYNCGVIDHLSYDYGKRVDHGSSWAKNNNTHKSKSPRPAVYKTHRSQMRPIRPYMNAAQPKITFFHKPAHSYNKRPFQRTSAVRSQFRGLRVATVNRKFPTVNRKLPTVNRKFPTGNTKFSTADLGNISYLTDYEPYDGGYVSFGQGGCKIIGKGTIKTGKLEFENVYFVKDLKTPRQHNMYTIDLNSIVPHKDLTCLVAKASADENMLWHMRLEIKNLKELRVKIIRVLVNKSQNKTPYELFNGRSAAIGFLKPFGCHVMILNTLDNLGKFKAKGDEGYFLGYSMSSKAFRVFNKRTKRVKEKLHVDFLENKPIEKGAGPNWLFVIDSLTNSMNYVPVVVVGTNSTNFSGTKEAAGQDMKKDMSSLRYIVLPTWFHKAHLDSSTRNAQDTCSVDAPESSGNFNPTATSTNPLADHMETLAVETPIPTVRSPVPTACLNDSPEPSSDTRLISKRVTSQDDTPSLDNILSLTNRLFLAYASFMGFKVYQMDVKSAFLYGTIDEEVLSMPCEALSKEISSSILLLQYIRRTRIAQSSVLPPVADEPASPLGDDSQVEACPIDSGVEADQDRANIAKTSTLPSDSTPRVTSLAADEGTQELEINSLKARIKLLEDKDGGVADQSRDDAPIKGRRLDEGEEAAERVSDDTEEMATVLTSMDAVSILTSGGVQVVPTPAEVATATISIPTGSGVVSTASPTIPTASPIFTTTIDSTPYTRRKGKEKMVESDTPKKKKLQEQIDVQDAEIARIYAEEELQMLIDRLDRNNETVAKYLQEYNQFAAELPIERRIELISDLVKYQDSYAKAKHFKGMTLEEIKEKFDLVWQQIQDFIPISSKEEAKRFKRKGIRLEQKSVKKLKTSEEVKITEEVPEEKVKEMMQLVSVEEIYVEALQVKHFIIDWKVHTKGQRSYWKIIRLGGSSASYQFFMDMLKHLDREDLNQLWELVKETLSIRIATSDKEMEIWVELKRLYEPDVEDQLWTLTQNLMHAPVEWKLYDTCRVHHVTSKDKEIFMLVEKDYPLRKGLEIIMTSYKLQVENYSQMANDLILKIYKIASSPRQQDD